MKKILIRSGMSQFDTFNAIDIIEKGSIGLNVGNLIYPFSIYRNLYNENVELVSDYYKNSPNDADFINENYSAYILPLANGIRKSFIPALRRYTDLINKLTIPVYLIGLGLKDHFDANGRKGFSYDADVRNFIKAVLQRSTMVGLRGQTTADYLSYLGFKEGVDHQAIGCPSMYTFGNEIKIKDFSLSDQSIICTNMTPAADWHTLEFINQLHMQYENATFIPQDEDELILTYLGMPYFRGNIKSDHLTNYPNSINSYVYAHGKVKYYLNAKTWIDDMKNVDLSIGTRLHGNIAPTLAGTPSITIPIDERMNELCKFHQFPTITQAELSENNNLGDVVEKIDFKSVEKMQERNFNNFISFLDKNEIEHGYDNAHNEQPFDKLIASLDFPPPVTPITSCNREEMIDRTETGYDIIRRKIYANEKKHGKNIADLNKKITKLKKNIENQKDELALRASKSESKRLFPLFKR